MGGGNPPASLGKKECEFRDNPLFWDGKCLTFADENNK